MFLLGVGSLLVLIAVLVNWGPLDSYNDAKGRLDKANEAVVQLEAEKSRLQAELGRLSEADYLESLARQDLAYTRPGEELYIVTGMEAASSSGLSSGASAASTGSGPGFLERALGPLLDGH